MRNAHSVETIGEGKGDEVHITSIVVRAQPGSLPQVCTTIENMAGAEIHSQDVVGKLIFTLETESLAMVTECLDVIARLDGVIDATLVYHQIELAHRLDDTIEIELPRQQTEQ